MMEYLQHKVHDRLLDGEQVIFLDFLVNFLNLLLVPEQPSRHHAHDPLEPTLVDARNVP